MAQFWILFAAFLASTQCTRYVAYYTSWSIYARNYTVADIPVEKLTHIFYAFANISQQGQISLADPWADIQKPWPGDVANQAYNGNFWQLLNVSKTRNPQLKVSISIGGWTMSGQFSSVCSSVQTRSVFIKSVVEFLNSYPFDGVDLDWEYPISGGLDTNGHSPNDADNFALLLSEMRQALDLMPGQRKLLTTAMAAGTSYIGNYNLTAMLPSIDFFNLMTYDYRTSLSFYTGHHTPLYCQSSFNETSNDPDLKLGCADMAVKTYLWKGVPREKINLGFPMYGHGWTVNSQTQFGLFQTVGSLMTGSYDDATSGTTGILDYKHIEMMVRNGTLYTYHDRKAGASWAFGNTSADAARFNFVSFESRQSLMAKIAYVQAQNLGGLMTWDLSGDLNGELSYLVNDRLLKTVRNDQCGD